MCCCLFEMLVFSAEDCLKKQFWKVNVKSNHCAHVCKCCVLWSASQYSFKLAQETRHVRRNMEPWAIWAISFNKYGFFFILKNVAL